MRGPKPASRRAGSASRRPQDPAPPPERACEAGQPAADRPRLPEDLRLEGGEIGIGREEFEAARDADGDSDHPSVDLDCKSSGHDVPHTLARSADARSWRRPDRRLFLEEECRCPRCLRGCGDERPEPPSPETGDAPGPASVRCCCRDGLRNRRCGCRSSSCLQYGRGNRPVKLMPGGGPLRIRCKMRAGTHIEDMRRNPIFQRFRCHGSSLMSRLTPSGRSA